MLLLLSNSLDGSADVLAGLCAERLQPVFRFNIDLWLNYQFAWTSSGFAIRDPFERVVISEEISACLWRRPTLRDTPSWQGGTAHDREATQAELHAIVWELAEWARARGRLRLIDPSAPRRVGRLAQMRVAEAFFTVPEWALGWGFRWPAERRMVKRFATEALGPARDRYIFVRSVDAEHLSPGWPWLTQEVGRGVRDATVLYVHGRCFGFEMERTRAELGVEDWRTLIGTDRNRWRPWALPAGVSERIVAYMERLGLRFGRLDLLVGDGEPSFLEVNPTGQFGWLDEPNGWPLHRAVLDAALNPTSAVRGDESVFEVQPQVAKENQGDQKRMEPTNEEAIYDNANDILRSARHGFSDIGWRSGGLEKQEGDR